jgi:hypothetical protein
MKGARVLSEEKTEDKQYSKPKITDHGDLAELTAGKAHGARADHVIFTSQIATFLSGP